MGLLARMAYAVPPFSARMACAVPLLFLLARMASAVPLSLRAWLRPCRHMTIMDTDVGGLALLFGDGMKIEGDADMFSLLLHLCRSSPIPSRDEETIRITTIIIMIFIFRS